jgi:hypothetical protein
METTVVVVECVERTGAVVVLILELESEKEEDSMRLLAVPVSKGC